MANTIYSKATELFENKRDAREMKAVLANVNVTKKDKDGRAICGTVTAPLDMLRFPRYQKDRMNKLNEDKIYNISRNFDPGKAGYIEVIPNYEYGTLDVADGLGRVIAASLAGIEFISVNVHVNVAQEDIERYGASLYADQYDNVRAMKPCHQHTARLILGDPEVKVLDRVSSKCHVLVNPTKEDKEKGIPWVKSYSDALSIVKVNGAEGLEFAYKVIQRAGWDIEAYGYSAYALGMLKYVYQAYGKERAIVGKFGTLLRDYTPTKFKDEAHRKYPQRSDFRVSCALLADDMLKEIYGKKNRLVYVDNRIRVAS